MLCDRLGHGNVELDFDRGNALTHGAHAYHVTGAAGHRHVGRRNQIGDHAELPLELAREHRHLALEVLHEVRGGLISLDRERVLLHERVDSLMNRHGIIERRHLGLACAIELESGHLEFYFTRSSLGFSRNWRPTRACGLPSTRTTSAVKSKTPRYAAAPMPYASTGAFSSSNS